MPTREQLQKDLTEIGKRFTRAAAHGDIDQMRYLAAERDRLLDELLTLRKLGR